MLMVLALAACADTPRNAEIFTAHTLPGSDGLELELTQRIELTGAMRDALEHGIPLRLQYQVDTCHQTRELGVWLRHAPLKRQYELQVEADSEVRGFTRLASLSAALDRIRLPLDLPVDARCAGTVHVRLDLAALPTPLRFPAFFHADQWQLLSRTYRWDAP